MSRQLDRWLTVREAAEKAGVPPWKMLRRLKALQQHDPKILKRFAGQSSRGRWYVSISALKAHLGAVPDPDEITAQLEDQARRLAVLRASVARLSKRVLALEQSTGR